MLFYAFHILGNLLAHFDEVSYIFCHSITNVQVSLPDLVPKLEEKLKHAFHGHHKHADVSLQVITDIYPLSFLTTLWQKQQFQASKIKFQDQYLADESSVAHTLASAFH